MNLKRYKVQNFRSVEDSTWIDCDDTTTLVGINESGKSNLLLALWKLNPVNSGEIDTLHDLPATKLSEFRDKISEIEFIKAQFELDDKDNENIQNLAPTDTIFPRVDSVMVSRRYDKSYVVEFPDSVTKAIPISVEETEQSCTDDILGTLRDIIIKLMPKFVYYSNYGNLSSKIYLPHAIKWLNGEQVPGIEQSPEQIRTLAVLFKFVNLNPAEILQLGAEAQPAQSQREQWTNKRLEEYKDLKEKRALLLKSASSKLTAEFRQWWKQGNYNFRLAADGNFFSISVSDDKRPEEVDLSLRSTGLQWFLSFYLVFLVESEQAHKNAILLLDEAGLTLHPNAQKDLSRFFDGLSKQNQLLLTTHSPFIIDTDNIDRCRVVYSNEHGKTVVSSNLRASATAEKNNSIYAIYSALGLNASDILLQGCQPVVVEGASDQYYLTAIKNILIKEKLIAPKRELVFIPSGGVKGIAGVSSLISGKNDGLPFVILDSDESGKNFSQKLQKDLYKDTPNRIVQLNDIVGFDGAEVEDLISQEKLDQLTEYLTRGSEEEFMVEENKPYLPQFEKFAKNQGISLPHGWKVDLARSFKSKSLHAKYAPSPKELDLWQKLFNRIL